MSDDYDEDSGMTEAEYQMAKALGLVGYHRRVSVKDLATGEETTDMEFVFPVGFWDAARMRQRERRDG